MFNSFDTEVRLSSFFKELKSIHLKKMMFKTLFCTIFIWHDFMVLLMIFKQTPAASNVKLFQLKIVQSCIKTIVSIEKRTSGS